MIDIIRKQKKPPVDRYQTQFVAFDFGALVREMARFAGTAQYRRVDEMIELVSGLQPGIEKRERLRIITRLGNILPRYRWGRRILPSVDGYRVITQMERPGALAADKWEHDMVAFLLSTVDGADSQTRIRRCADRDCREWFFAAKRIDQEFCGPNCRQHNYDADPQRAEAKRKRMHDAYIQAKDRALNPKNGVGLRTKTTGRNSESHLQKDPAKGKNKSPSNRSYKETY